MNFIKNKISLGRFYFFYNNKKTLTGLVKYANILKCVNMYIIRLYIVFIITYSHSNDNMH